MKINIRIAALITSGLYNIHAIHADIIFNNMESGFSSANYHEIGWDYNSSDPSASFGLFHAVSFTSETATSDWDLGEVRLPLSLGSGNLNIKISLVEDKNGSPTGAEIWSITNPASINDQLIAHVFRASGIVAQASVFWIVAGPHVTPGDESADGIVRWYHAAPPTTSLESDNTFNGSSGNFLGWNNSASTDAAAIRVDGVEYSPVPEPTTTIFFAIGTILCIYTIRRQASCPAH